MEGTDRRNADDWKDDTTNVVDWNNLPDGTEAKNAANDDDHDDDNIDDDDAADSAELILCHCILEHNFALSSRQGTMTNHK